MKMKKQDGDFKKILKTEDEKIYFIKRIYELIHHGYSLEDSLEFLFLQYNANEDCIASLKKYLYDGKKLSDILTLLGYPNSVVNKMQFAENYGKIELMLLDIKKYLLLKKEQKLKILKTIRYPLFLTIMLISLIMVFNVLVIPQFANIYNTSNISMDFQVIVLIKILYYLPKFIIIFIILLVFFVTFILFIYKFKKILFLNFIVKIPILRKYFILYFSYKFSFELSLFLLSGFSLKTALEIINSKNYDFFLKNFSEILLEKLEKGESFEESIENINYIEKSMKKFIIHGKNNSMLDVELNLFSELMLDTFLSSLDKLLKKIQPILFLILAFVIVGLYMVILLPVFSMTNTLK